MMRRLPGRDTGSRSRFPPRRLLWGVVAVALVLAAVFGGEGRSPRKAASDKSDSLTGQEVYVEPAAPMAQGEKRKASSLVFETRARLAGLGGVGTVDADGLPEEYLAFSAEAKRTGEEAVLDQVVRDMDQALALDPDLAEAWRLKGQALLMSGENDEAARAFEEALAKDLSRRSIYLGLFTARLEAGRTEEARVVLDRYAETFEVEAPDRQVLEATLDLYAGRAAMAGERAAAIVEQNPGDGLAWQILAASLEARGRMEEAEEAWSEAAAASPLGSGGVAAVRKALRERLRGSGG